VDYALFDRSLVDTVLLEPLNRGEARADAKFQPLSTTMGDEGFRHQLQDVANERRQVVGAQIGLELDERHAAVLIA
jgi:hypothetical protein